MIEWSAKAKPSERAEDRLPGPSEVDLDRLAHELRSPLAAIQSMAEALADGHLGPVDPRHATYLASIRDTARHALAVIAGMVGAAHDLEGPFRDPEPVELSRVAAEVAQGMGLLAARAAVRLEAAVAGNPPVIARASPTDVRQMLINLMSNGIAHSGGGATIAVTTGSNGCEAWIEVADNGPGIAAGVLDRLATGAPLDGDTQGAAGSRIRLGLTLTRQLAAANGGRLEIASSPEGTRARIVLPVTAADAPGS